MKKYLKKSGNIQGLLLSLNESWGKSLREARENPNEENPGSINEGVLGEILEVIPENLPEAFTGENPKGIPGEINDSIRG